MRPRWQAALATVLAAAIAATAAAAAPAEARADGPVATGEPNDTYATAVGPLRAGVVYTGQTDTNTDEDWLFVSTGPGAAQLTVAVSQPARGTCVDDGDGAFATLFGGDPDTSDPLGQAMGAGTGPPQTFTVAVTGPATYWLSVGTSCAPGAPWQVQVATTGTLSGAPALAPGTAPPTGTPTTPSGAPAPSRAATCARARRSTRRWSARVSATRRDLGRRHSAEVRRLLRRILTLQRTTLRHVRARATLNC